MQCRVNVMPPGLCGILNVCGNLDWRMTIYSLIRIGIQVHKKENQAQKVHKDLI